MQHLAVNIGQPMDFHAGGRLFPTHFRATEIVLQPARMLVLFSGSKQSNQPGLAARYEVTRRLSMRKRVGPMQAVSVDIALGGWPGVSWAQQLALQQ